MPLPAMQVSRANDRPSIEDQIETILQRARELGKPARVRIPVLLYDYRDRGSEQYVALRESAWNLQFPIEQTTPATLQELIETIGKCVVAVATHGSEAVTGKLEELG